MVQRPRPTRVRFRRFELDRQTGELFEDGVRVPLQHKPARLLVVLTDQPHRALSRRELEEALWEDDVFVDRETGLNTAVRKLREALSDDAQHPRFVETVPRIGYRFVAEVTPAGTRAPRATIGFIGAPSGWLAASILATLVGLVALVLIVVSGRGRPLASHRAAAGGAISEEAQRAYVDGLYLKSQRDPDSVGRAIDSLRLAVTIEPRHAGAWAHLAESLAIGWFIAPSSERWMVENARRSVERALELDRDLPAALRAKGMVALHHDWEFMAAGEALRRAAELAPGVGENHLAFATWLSVMGRHEEALSSVNAAIALDPASFAVKSDAGFFLLRAGHLEEAVQECERAVRLAPEFTPAQSCLVEANRRLGNWSVFRRHATGLLRIRGGSPDRIALFTDSADPEKAWSRLELERLEGYGAARPVSRARHLAILGDHDAAMRWLEAAYAERHPRLVFVGGDSAFVGLRGEKRFVELLARIGLRTESPRLDPVPSPA